MAGRGPQTFKKRQKEQERKERQQEKLAKRLRRKAEKENGGSAEPDEDLIASESKLDEESESMSA